MLANAKKTSLQNTAAKSHFRSHLSRAHSTAKLNSQSKNLVFQSVIGPRSVSKDSHGRLRQMAACESSRGNQTRQNNSSEKSDPNKGGGYQTVNNKSASSRTIRPFGGSPGIYTSVYSTVSRSSAPGNLFTVYGIKSSCAMPTDISHMELKTVQQPRYRVLCLRCANDGPNDNSRCYP